ncbi:MAG: A/G-specific adenine glycosylase [Candidatus Omnitrophota bacterium]|nr:A/G-specific adenine glycosylase [Candidatus Omnitrophota bacterium]
MTFQRGMIRWYRKESRKNLPWRKTRDPYRIWISEAMLQQTQVATVIPYYERFLVRFPTVHSLSKAPLTDVLDTWSGLGYYSRAKNLHVCAQTIVRDHGGSLPAEVDSLLKLPGIGRYTAGAIASIAFDRPAPILDGNVQRVLCRYLGIREDPRQPEIQRRLWKLAEQLVPAKNPGDFNQAMMELGALLCTPREPQCGRCPLSPDCLARRKGWQDSIPPPRRTAARKKLSYPCAVLRKGDSVLIARRPIATLLPGLWEFPGGELRPREPFLAGLRRHLADRLGIVPKNPKPCAATTQILSHRELELRAFSCTWSGKLAQPRWYMEMKWVPLRHLDKVPFTAGMAELARLLRKESAG